MTITHVWQSLKPRQKHGKELQLKTNKHKTASGMLWSRAVGLRSWNQVNWNEVSSAMSSPLVGSKLEVREKIGDVRSQWPNSWPLWLHCYKNVFFRAVCYRTQWSEVFCCIRYWPSFVYSTSQNNQHNLVINEMWENHFTHMCFMKLQLPYNT